MANGSAALKLHKPGVQRGSALPDYKPRFETRLGYCPGSGSAGKFRTHQLEET